MSPVSIRQIIEQAIAKDHTVAASLGMATLGDWFAPILSHQMANFCLDSRKIGEQDGFVLLKSTSQDTQAAIDSANRYIQAVKDTASFIITEFDADVLVLDGVSIPVVSLPTIRTILGDLIAARFQFDESVPLPTVIAVTGTNGKTTVSQLIAQLCQL